MTVHYTLHTEDREVYLLHSRRLYYTYGEQVIIHFAREEGNTTTERIILLRGLRFTDVKLYI